MTSDQSSEPEGAGMPTEAKQGPLRATRQRAAIVAALEAATSFLTVQELHHRLQAGGQRVGLATVYRQLQALAEAAEIDVLRSPDGQTRYRRCHQGHHHHLICRDCGHAIEITGARVDRWADRIATEHGYAQITHTLEIFGICPDCLSRTPT
jgi:Fur family ferric uptake transcriptional regulator